MSSVYLTLTLNTYLDMCQGIKKDPNSPNTIICTRWLESFHNFIEDMGYQPDGMILGMRSLQKQYAVEALVFVITPVSKMVYNF